MTDRPDYSEIIARLEKASGPDRELDVPVAIAMGWTNFERSWGELRAFPPKAAYWVEIPAFTASLDASLALVGERLPDAWWTMGSRSPLCNLWRGDNTCIGSGDGATPTISVLLALFRALESGA